jgi:hypothetical protein
MLTGQQVVAQAVQVTIAITMQSVVLADRVKADRVL